MKKFNVMTSNACQAGKDEILKAGSLAKAWDISTNPRRMMWLLGELHIGGHIDRKTLVRATVACCMPSATDESKKVLNQLLQWFNGEAIDLIEVRADAAAAAYSAAAHAADAHAAHAAAAAAAAHAAAYSAAADAAAHAAAYSAAAAADAAAGIRSVFPSSFLMTFCEEVSDV